jgi:hypothetical protein
VRSRSARRTGEPKESRGAVKTRVAAEPQAGHGTAEVAVPMGQRASVVPCSGQRYT